jgi:ankyrin repeat protein
MKCWFKHCLLPAILILAIGCATTQSHLMLAARDGKTDTVKALIEAGADVNAKDRQGKTALVVASEKGHLDSVKILLDNGADVNAKTKDGCTALMFAENIGHREVVRILKEAGAKE